MTVAVVVLNFNGAEETIQCVESLLASRYRDFCVVMVDNASTDDSARRLSEWIGRRGSEEVDCELIIATRNGGYAAGNNLGAERARQLDASYVWLLNNDTVVDPGTLALLVAAAEADPSVGALGCSVVDLDPPHAVQYVGGGRFKRLSTRQHYVGRGLAMSEIPTESAPIDYIGGASMFCRSPALQAAGGLNEDYFLFYEELDLAHRLDRAGMKIAVEPRAVVYHRGGATTGSEGEKSPLASFHGARSCLIYLRRWQPYLVPNALLVRTLHAALLAFRSRPLSAASLRGLRAGMAARLGPGSGRGGA